MLTVNTGQRVTHESDQEAVEGQSNSKKGRRAQASGESRGGRQKKWTMALASRWNQKKEESWSMKGATKGRMVPTSGDGDSLFHIYPIYPKLPILSNLPKLPILLKLPKLPILPILSHMPHLYNKMDSQITFSKLNHPFKRSIRPHHRIHLAIVPLSQILQQYACQNSSGPKQNDVEHHIRLAPNIGGKKFSVYQIIGIA